MTLRKNRFAIQHLSNANPVLVHLHGRKFYFFLPFSDFFVGAAELTLAARDD
jgi:hypothetical protein